MIKRAIMVIIVLIVVGVVGYFGYQAYAKENNIGKRQAIFLSNGQVYFGYTSNLNSQVVKLSDVYYLKTSELGQNTADLENKKILLVKAGSELHNPDSTMYINRDQILFSQTLKNDSRINSAIAKYNQK